MNQWRNEMAIFTMKKVAWGFHFLTLSLFFYFFQYFDWNFSIFHLWKAFYFACKSNVGTGISTLMYISDEQGSSIFPPKMEKARPMRKEMDGEVSISRQSLHSSFDV